MSWPATGQVLGLLGNSGSHAGPHKIQLPLNDEVVSFPPLNGTKRRTSGEVGAHVRLVSPTAFDVRNANWGTQSTIAVEGKPRGVAPNSESQLFGSDSRCYPLQVP